MSRNTVFRIPSLGAKNGYKHRPRYVRFKLNNKVLIFFVDNGADVSLISVDHVDKNSVDYDDPVLISGIDGVEILTLGNTFLNLEVNSNSHIKHPFQVVDHKVHLFCDGILGYDFLTAHDAVLRCGPGILELLGNNFTMLSAEDIEIGNFLEALPNVGQSDCHNLSSFSESQSPSRVVEPKLHLSPENCFHKSTSSYSSPPSSVATLEKPIIQDSREQGILQPHANSSDYPKSSLTHNPKSHVTLNVTNNNKSSLATSCSIFKPRYDVEQFCNTSKLNSSSSLDSTSDSAYSSDSDTPLPSIELPARCEMFVRAKILNPKINEGIVPDIHLPNGVLLSRAITLVDQKTGTAIVSMVNSTQHHVSIPKLEFELEKLPKKSKCFAISAKAKIQERFKLLESSVRTEHLNSDEKNALLSLCKNYNDIFLLEGDQLSSTPLVQHSIPTSDDQPVFTKTYRFPHIHKQEVEDQVDKMLKQKIIRPSKSPYNSPLWVVPKKLDASGKRKWRIVIDYRKLNQKTIGDAYPLPLINEILDQLGRSRYFTTLDLASGFQQIEVDTSSVPKTAFSTPNGHFEYLRMPFGLKNAPATFQRLMNVILTGIQGISAFVYMDDIVVYSADLAEHIARLTTVFDRLRSANLKLQIDKCEFFRKEVCYLGHVISDKGVSPNPETVNSVVNFPTPKNVKQIQSFLGLTGYYRRFVPHYSDISSPLTRLTKKDVPFLWGNEQENSFRLLKELLVNPPILQYPDFSKEFILSTDASNIGIGALLSQGTIGDDRPIAYASRTLNRAERNYSTTEKECLAVVWAVKNFRPYLYGRPFTIVTDHRPLLWLFNHKEPGSKLIRWRLKLEEYDYKIVHKAGKLHTNADCLSRLPMEESPVSQTSPVDIPSRISSSDSHPVINLVHQVDTISDFTKAFNLDEINPLKSFSEVDTSILSSNHPIAYLNSLDLSPKNPYSSDILDMLVNKDELIQSERSLYSIHKSLSKSNIPIYHCFIKVHDYDVSSYPDLFHVLQNLRIKLEEDGVTHISLPNFENSSDRFTFNKVKDMLYFIFRHGGITVTVHHAQIVTPDPKDIPNILKQFHDSPVSGHAGFNRTYKRIMQQFRWKNMKKQIRDYITKCESCQRNKVLRRSMRNPMEITTTSSHPFQRLFLDVVGPFPSTVNGNKYILTLEDDLTKFIQAYPMANHEAETVAQCLTHHISLFGIPRTIISDNGSEFIADIIKRLARLFKFHHTFISFYHPQSNGALERTHSTVKEYFRHYVNSDQTNWDTFLPTNVLAYNTAVHTSTRFTPFELIFGNKCLLPTSVTQDPAFRYTYNDYVDHLQQRLNANFQTARNNQIASKNKSKLYYDKKVHPRPRKFKVGDKVYLRNEKAKPGLSRKLSSPFLGPFTVINVYERNNFGILRNGNEYRVNGDRLKLGIPCDD
jgi:transposase InsO family protein